MASTINIWTSRLDPDEDGGERWTQVDVGTAKLLPPKRIKEGNYYDEVGTYHRLARVSPGISPRNAIEAIKSTLTATFTNHCSHSYDCCGCPHAHVTVRRLRGRTYSVISAHYRNY